MNPLILLTIYITGKYSPNNLIGNCTSTLYGCCNDNITFCSHKYCSNCVNTNLIGDCSSTQYGCCYDNITYCTDIKCTNCIVKMINQVLVNIKYINNTFDKNVSNINNYINRASHTYFQIILELGISPVMVSLIVFPHLDTL